MKYCSPLDSPQKHAQILSLIGDDDDDAAILVDGDTHELSARFSFEAATGSRRLRRRADSYKYIYILHERS